MVALGILVAALGMLCLGGGLALLVWRLLQPDSAVILPPGYAGTPEPTLTPGVLREVLPPPPLPDDPAQIVMLPASARLTATPIGTRATDTRVSTVIPSDTPFLTASVSPAPTRAATVVPLLTATATQPAPLTVTVTRTPTATASPTPIPLPAIPDRIVIDAIGLDAPVVPVGQQPLLLDGQLYSQWEVPNRRAAGWHQSSAPLGQPGNTVLNGHHNVYGEVFHYLLALQPGDIVTLISHETRTYYIVAQTMTLAEEGQPVEVRQANARWILPTRDERVTLITCWPYDASSHRLVVVALPLAILGDTVEMP